MDIRDRLRKLRKYREISAKDLARIAGISVNTLQALENKKMWPNLETVIKICNVLEADITINLRSE